MKFFATYWLIGCLIVGAGAGLYDRRCPNDAYLTPTNLLIELVCWPTGIVFAIFTHDKGLSSCTPKQS